MHSTYTHIYYGGVHLYTRNAVYTCIIQDPNCVVNGGTYCELSLIFMAMTCSILLLCIRVSDHGVTAGRTIYNIF